MPINKYYIMFVEEK